MIGLFIYYYLIHSFHSFLTFSTVSLSETLTWTQYVNTTSLCATLYLISVEPRVDPRVNDLVIGICLIYVYIIDFYKDQRIMIHSQNEEPSEISTESAGWKEIIKEVWNWSLLYLPFPSNQLDQMLILHTEREGGAHHHLPAAAQPQVQLPLHSPAVQRIRGWATSVRGVATPALLCHKEPARRIQSPLLGALGRNAPY